MYIRNNLGYNIVNNEYYLETNTRELNKIFKETSSIYFEDCCHLIKNNKVLFLNEKKVKNNGKNQKYSYIYNIDIKNTSIKLELLKKYIYLENLKDLLVIFNTFTNNSIFLLNEEDYKFIKNFFKFLFDDKFFKELNTSKNLNFTYVYPVKYFFVENTEIFKKKEIKEFLIGEKIIFHRNLKFLFYRFTGTVFVNNTDKKFKFNKKHKKLKILKEEIKTENKNKLNNFYEELFKYLLYLYYKNNSNKKQKDCVNNLEKKVLIDYLHAIIEEEIEKNKKTNIIKQYNKFLKILNITGIKNNIDLQIFKSKYKILKNKIYNQINQSNILQFL